MLTAARINMWSSFSMMELGGRLFLFSFFFFRDRDSNLDCQGDSLALWALLHCNLRFSKVVMGQAGQIFLPGLGQFFVGRVSHLWFPLINPNFPIFPFGLKKIASGWVKKYPGLSRVSLLFTAGQKYAQVRALHYSSYIFLCWWHKQSG